MITARDEKAIEFIDVFGIATTKQINEVAYGNMRVCQRRLTVLNKMGVLYRENNLYTKEYLYSMKKPNLKQLKHKLIRNDFYIKLRTFSDVLLHQVEQPLGCIRPDGTFIISLDKTGKQLFLALEVESSNNTINVTKYEKLALSGQKPMPLVVYVTAKNIPVSKHFKWVKVSPSLSNLEEVLL